MSILNKIKGLREVWFFDNRWELIRSRLFGSDSETDTYRIKDLVFFSNHDAGDANGARAVLTSNMYRRYLREIDKSKAINVLDIGANNGGFPLLLKLEGFTINKGVSVEFNPATFSRLHANIEQNFGGEYESINAAVCGEDRLVTVVDKIGGTADSIYRQLHETDSGKIVEGLTFNKLYERAFADQIIDVCKMDIEGAEFEVFGHDQCDKITKCRFFIVEIHHSDQTRRESVISKLEQFGFEEVNGDNKRAEDEHYVHFFINKRI
jgi:FkbM family methyltransferase